MVSSAIFITLPQVPLDKAWVTVLARVGVFLLRSFLLWREKGGACQLTTTLSESANQSSKKNKNKKTDEKGWPDEQYFVTDYTAESSLLLLQKSGFFGRSEQNLHQLDEAGIPPVVSGFVGSVFIASILLHRGATILRALEPAPMPAQRNHKTSAKCHIRAEGMSTV